MGLVTIAISCENFEKAKQAYKSWLNYLLDTDPGCVEDYCEASLCIYMDRIFRYIFFDSYMEELFGTFSDQILYQDEFFFLEGVSQNYWKYEERVW